MKTILYMRTDWANNLESIVQLSSEDTLLGIDDAVEDNLANYLENIHEGEALFFE